MTINEPSTVPTVYNETTTGDALLSAMAHHALELDRQSRMLYDHSRPVDEYISTPGWPAGGYIEVTPTYEIHERIESILAVIPIGVTNAQLQLGDRWLTLYQGVALTSSLMVNLHNLGIIIGRDDARYLQLTPGAQPGGATGGVHLELMGFADEIWGKA